ncbi:MAG: DUF5667 domain-containing protein [Candidatus Levyibacteriota bacterium]
MNRQNNKHKSKYGVTILLCACLLTISAFPVHADDNPPLPSPTPTSTYQLPYPGMLPDNPLYFLKSFRDNMIGFFIGKPIDKADFMLLQSDKQVSASSMLVSQTKIDLAASAFSQAQDYFDEAIEQTVNAHKQGMNITEMTKKLAEANQKHFQVLDEIDQQLSEADKKKFQKAQNKETDLAKKIKGLKI